MTKQHPSNSTFLANKIHCH